MERKEKEAIRTSKRYDVFIKVKSGEGNVKFGRKMALCFPVNAVRVLDADRSFF